MKIEEFNLGNSKHKIELSVKKKQQIEKEFLGNITPHKNHTLWEINIETLEIKPAKYIQKPIILGQNDKKEVLQRDGFAYVSALSKKTALDKFNKGENGSKFTDSNFLKM